MKKTLLLLFYIPFVAQTLEQPLALPEITQTNAENFLRPGTPTQNFPHLLSDEISITGDEVVDFSQNLLQGIARTDRIETFLEQTNPDTPQNLERAKKEGTGGALVAGAVAVPLILVAGTKTRSPDTLIVAGLAAGIAVCATGGLAWALWGNYMKTIISFKGSLHNALAELAELQGTVAQLQKQQSELREKTAETIKFSQQILDEFPRLKEVSGDNARLASVMQLILDRQQALESMISERMTDSLSEAEINELQRNRTRHTSLKESITQAGRKRQVIDAYNRQRGWFTKKIKRFEDVPQAFRDEHMAKPSQTRTEEV